MKIIKVRVSDEEMDAKAAKKMPHVKKAIASAKSVLSIFEKEYPGDKGPRKAIEAAEDWVKNPTEMNKKKAKSAYASAVSSSQAANKAANKAASYASASSAQAASAAGNNDITAVKSAAAGGFYAYSAKASANINSTSR